ncbi:Unknown protein [Striga hermonthica]|uniref:GRF-type domain-containing protein n=1 Tax=Striga hermonthica TaxID=68872 RepID=A0A9N7NEY2_STRHE|nr:Unknown protein [Striga hermonthica]
MTKYQNDGFALPIVYQDLLKLWLRHHISNLLPKVDEEAITVDAGEDKSIQKMSDSTTSSWRSFCSTNSRSSGGMNPTCRHGVEAELLTSQTDQNPARRFYRCSLPKDQDCRFFVWLDAELPPYQKGCYLKLKSQNKSLEEQLRCKQVMEKLLAERLEMKVKEMDLLKIEIDELEKKVKECTENLRKARKMLFCFCAMVLVLCSWLMIP